MDSKKTIEEIIENAKQECKEENLKKINKKANEDDGWPEPPERKRDYPEYEELDR